MSEQPTSQLLAISGFIVVLLLWQFITQADLIAPFFLPSPSEVVDALFTLFSRQEFLADIGISIQRISIGFIAAALLAVPIGVLLGTNRTTETILEPLIDFVRYTPIPAFIPLFILWFGIGELEKIVVIGASVFFQLVLMVANSVSHTPREVVETAQSLGATRWQVLYRVIFAQSLPRIIDDLRISMGWAWSGLMMAEIVGSISGIGFVIIQSQRLLKTDNVVAAIIVVGLLGIVTDQAFKLFRAQQYPWLKRSYHA